MAGDSPAEDGAMPTGTDEYLSHPWVGRMIIAAAGPAANLVGAFFVLVLTGLVGFSYPDYPSVLGPMPDTSAAVAHGLRAGDRIVAMDGRPVHTRSQILA